MNTEIEKLKMEYRVRANSYPSPPDIKEFRKILEIKRPQIKKEN